VGSDPNQDIMSATPTIKQKDDGIPTYSVCALYRMALYGIYASVLVVCDPAESLNLLKQSRDYGIEGP
jgi:hypothetical protein